MAAPRPTSGRQGNMPAGAAAFQRAPAQPKSFRGTSALDFVYGGTSDGGTPSPGPETPLPSRPERRRSDTAAFAQPSRPQAAARPQSASQPVRGGRPGRRLVQAQPGNAATATRQVRRRRSAWEPLPGPATPGGIAEAQSHESVGATGTAIGDEATHTVGDLAAEQVPATPGGVFLTAVKPVPSPVRAVSARRAQLPWAARVPADAMDIRCWGAYLDIPIQAEPEVAGPWAGRPKVSKQPSLAPRKSTCAAL